MRPLSFMSSDVDGKIASLSRRRLKMRELYLVVADPATVADRVRARMTPVEPQIYLIKHASSN